MKSKRNKTKVTNNEIYIILLLGVCLCGLLFYISASFWSYNSEMKLRNTIANPDDAEEIRKLRLELKTLQEISTDLTIISEATSEFQSQHQAQGDVPSVTRINSDPKQLTPNKDQSLIVHSIPNNNPIAPASSNVNAHVNIPLKTAINGASSSESEHASNPAVLIVGGTDGSGSRKVVTLLAALGTSLVSEDQETYDIHADLAGGWPTFVTPVVQHAKTLNYEPESFPSKLKASTTRALTRLMDRMRQDLHKPPTRRLGVGGAVSNPAGSSAKNVEVGFKAPVAMTLVPFYAHIEPHVKFLHVVRDGRDIAFSANRGPVQKFYKSMYNKNPTNSPLNAIQLWSDWNTQIYEWATAKSVASDRQKDTSFSYHVIHSEDLIDNSVDVRFTAISQLAEWVGSNLNDEQLCCLAVEDNKFMGSHDRTAIATAKVGEATSRYGKWKAKVGKNKQLENQLNSVGQSGLKIFGYEPLRKLPDKNSMSKNGFHCSYEKVAHLCPSTPDGNSVNMNFSRTSTCSIEIGVDYKGGDLKTSSAVETKSIDDCCMSCKQNTQGCKYFTFDSINNMCYLKSSKGMVIRGSGTGRRMISGNLK